MRRLGAFTVFLVALLVTGLATARAGSFVGSVTDVLDNSTETQACHDSPYYFNPIYGWARTCNGGHDIATNNAGSNPWVYIKGYNWTNATIVNAQSNAVYQYTNCTGFLGYEYNNAWQISVSSGTIGIGFHHMSNYHYAINSTVTQGTHVGEAATWNVRAYYCSGSLASTGTHIHTEAARDGTPDDTYLVDSWAFGGTAPSFPYIHYQ